MNQENYKEIAEIIKERRYNLIKQGLGGMGLLQTQIIAQKLADYFEKEDEIIIKDYAFDFNKEQFLKDCGLT